MSYTTETAILYLVASWACEVTLIPTQVFSTSLCEDVSDLTSQTSNHIHLAISVVNETFQKLFLPVHIYMV